MCGPVADVTEGSGGESGGKERGRVGNDNRHRPVSRSQRKTVKQSTTATT